MKYSQVLVPTLTTPPIHLHPPLRYWYIIPNLPYLTQLLTTTAKPRAAQWPPRYIYPPSHFAFPSTPSVLVFYFFHLSILFSKPVCQFPTLVDAPSESLPVEISTTLSQSQLKLRCSRAPVQTNPDVLPPSHQSSS